MKREGDNASVGAAEAHLSVRFQSGLSGDPGSQHKGWDLAFRSVDQRDLLKAGQFGERDPIIETVGESPSHLVGAGPGQIVDGKARTFVQMCCSEASKSDHWLCPVCAVDDESVDDAVEAVLEVVVEFSLPPENKREVGVEMGKDNVAHVAVTVALEAQGDLLGADGFFSSPELAVGGNPCAHRFFVQLTGLNVVDENGAAGVFLGDCGEESGVGLERIVCFAVDGEVHEGGPGSSAVGSPEKLQFLFDLRNGDLVSEGGMVGFGCAHGA